WASPVTGGNRLGFPESHPNFRGALPPGIGALAGTLAGHDLILVIGSSVFPYYPYIPGPLLPEGAALVAITSDPGEAARAPMGDAILGDVGLALERLLELCGSPPGRPGGARPRPGAGPAAGARRRGADQRLRGDGRTRRCLARGRDRRAREPVE